MSAAVGGSGVVMDELPPPPPQAEMPTIRMPEQTNLEKKLKGWVCLADVQMFMAWLFSRSVHYFIVGRMNTKPHLLQYPATPQGLAATSKLRMAMAASLLVLLAPLAAQAEWQKITTTDSGIIYVDDGSIKRNGPIRSFWSLLDYRTPQRAQRGAFFVSTRTHMEMDCRKEMVHILQFSMHSGPMLTGEIVDSQGVMREWQTIPPDTPLVALYKFICGK
jgi:hypothetical protein